MKITNSSSLSDMDLEVVEKKLWLYLKEFSEKMEVNYLPTVKPFFQRRAKNVIQKLKVEFHDTLPENSAGLAISGIYTIKLNLLLVTKDLARLHEVFGHEFAHIVVENIFPTGSERHGSPWQEAMKAIGLEPRVMHDWKID